jgi:hypothetical protein
VYSVLLGTVAKLLRGNGGENVHFTELFGLNPNSSLKTDGERIYSVRLIDFPDAYSAIGTMGAMGGPWRNQLIFFRVPGRLGGLPDCAMVQVYQPY